MCSKADAFILQLKAAQATSESAEDVDMQDAAAPAAAGSSKAKGKGKNARKGAMRPPAVPDAAGPSPADATAVAVADASGSLKRAGSPTEGDRPAKASTHPLHTHILIGFLS